MKIKSSIDDMLEFNIPPFWRFGRGVDDIYRQEG